jgi:hypothetical protein
MKALMDEGRFEEVELSFICERAPAKCGQRCLEELAEVGQLPIAIQIDIESIY